MSNKKEIDVNALYKSVSKEFKGRDIFLGTGPCGAQLFEIELAIEAFRFVEGREPTVDERKSIEAKFPIENYPSGYYEIDANGVRYKGLFDSTKKSGFYILKDADGKYYEEEWRDHRRIRKTEITEEAFNKFKSSFDNDQSNE